MAPSVHFISTVTQDFYRSPMIRSDASLIPVFPPCQNAACTTFQTQVCFDYNCYPNPKPRDIKAKQPILKGVAKRALSCSHQQHVYNHAHSHFKLWSLSFV